MGTNKTYEERIQAQKEIMKKAASKIKELEEAAAKKKEEQKQKKIESIMKDIEKALESSPLLSCNKKDEAYKKVIQIIRSGLKEAPEQEPETVPVPTPAPSIYEQIGQLAEAELGRPLQEGDQDRFKSFLEFQDRNTPYYRNAMNRG